MNTFKELKEKSFITSNSNAYKVTNSKSKLLLTITINKAWYAAKLDFVIKNNMNILTRALTLNIIDEKFYNELLLLTDMCQYKKNKFKGYAKYCETICCIAYELLYYL